MELNQEQIQIVKECLEYRRDGIIRRLDTYRKMKHSLDDALYEHLVGMSEIELEQVLSAHHLIR